MPIIFTENLSVTELIIYNFKHTLKQITLHRRRKVSNIKGGGGGGGGGRGGVAKLRILGGGH